MAEEKGKYYRVQKDYIRAYQGKMERIYLTMRPEEKQAIQAAADAAGMPTSAFVRAAIAEKMERDAASAIDIVTDAEEIDPVRSGKWVIEEYQSSLFEVDQKLVCSVCGYDHDWDVFFDYCPGCGAKMEDPYGDD